MDNLRALRIVIALSIIGTCGFYVIEMSSTNLFSIYVELGIYLITFVSVVGISLTEILSHKNEKLARKITWYWFGYFMFLSFLYTAFAISLLLHFDSNA